MHAEIPNVIAFSSGEDPPCCDNLGQERLAPSEAPGRGEKILVVDDSLVWLRLAREILTAGGYQAQTCEDPREALSLLEQNPERIDLVITDLQMPGLGGIELAVELLKINPTLPVVLTSAYMFRMPSERLRSLGIRDFLPKPWDRGQLFSIIRQALASKSKESQ
jgi:two-component system cell cycle sensor histidine kinase/response regulator CckA